MSVQSNEFAKKKATRIGSPVTARQIIGNATRRAQADSCAINRELLLAVDLTRPGFVNLFPVDPVTHPADLCQSVRAFAMTEGQMARICRAMGFTFWGQAVALVLGYAAAFPEQFSAADLKSDAPSGLLRAKGAIKRGHVLHAPGVRGIQAPLTPATADFLARTAGRQRLSRVDAASLILHRHVGRVAAMLADAATCD